MEPVDKESNAYIDFIVKHNSIFVKVYTPNWLKEAFVIKKVQHFVLGTYVTSDLNSEEIVGTFYEKELQETNETEFKVEKVVKRKKVINCKLSAKVVLIHLIVV